MSQSLDGRLKRPTADGIKRMTDVRRDRSLSAGVLRHEPLGSSVVSTVVIVAVPPIQNLPSDAVRFNLVGHAGGALSKVAAGQFEVVKDASKTP